ncbi:hypothetical protein JOQ06_024043 [Pogonophryne albipinna]|uniref:Uncharacterized protein n=1 Tax=Pogonophryne albipinna TaxID=1090488 RepID=A0AAD6BME7_9TELE|nr:hypothetical protein JOQ06_024043 [Pogonophryne albipinna]
MRKCTFEVDPGDARRLTEAKRSQLEGKHGMVSLTDAEEGESPTLSSRAELGPCNMAQRQPPGRGHLQPALPSPPRGHAVRRDHEDSVVFELNQRTLSQW